MESGAREKRCMTEVSQAESVSTYNNTYAPQLTIQEMYDLRNRKDLFGIEGYDPPKKYIDPILQMQQREMEQNKKKGQKSNKYVCKKGSYIDGIIKSLKQVPGPQKYHLTCEWVSKADIEKGKKRPTKTNRNTFVEIITKEAKARPVPGVGKYNLVKTEDQIKKELDELRKKQKQAKKTDKETFLSEYEYLGKYNPGPGQYNPHKEVNKLKVNTQKPEDWRKRHKTVDKVKKSQYPDVGTYKNNFPCDFMTFSKLLIESKEKTNKTKIPYLGKEERFKDPTKSKSQAHQVPGTGKYNLNLEWPGKVDPKKKDKPKNYLNSISRGISKSIYY